MAKYTSQKQKMERGKENNTCTRLFTDQPKPEMEFQQLHFFLGKWDFCYLPCRLCTEASETGFLRISPLWLIVQLKVKQYDFFFHGENTYISWDDFHSIQARPWLCMVHLLSFYHTKRFAIMVMERQRQANRFHQYNCTFLFERSCCLLPEQITKIL